MVRPIIQVSLRNYEARKQEIAADLWKAATEIGFFYLKDTGMSEVGERLLWLLSFAAFGVQTQWHICSAQPVD